MQTIDRIVSTVNRRVDESSPMVDARLPSGERVNVIIPPLSLVGPMLSIRRFPRAFTFEQLVRMGIGRPRHRRPAARAGARAHVDRRLRRHQLGQDDAAQRAVGLHPGRGADRHHRGLRRAPAPAAPRHLAGVAPAERRGQGPGHHPRPRAQLAAHAPRPHRRRRGPRPGDHRHAPGDEHRPRRLADHRPRQLGRGLDRAPADARLDERGRRALHWRCATRSTPPSTSSSSSSAAPTAAGGSSRSPPCPRACARSSAWRRSCASSPTRSAADRSRHRHLGALPAARRRRRPPARARRADARPSTPRRRPTSSRRPSAVSRGCRASVSDRGPDAPRRRPV